MPAAWFHLTARVSKSMPSLVRDDVGLWLWTNLRAVFPEAIAAVLMPDHPHLLVPSDDPAAARQRLARLLGHAARSFGVEGRASKVPDPQPVRAGLVLHRSVRYIALNPCRKRLARCPTAWWWSTHRDVVGAAADPWITAERLATALERPGEDFVERHHAYASADPHTHVAGTPLPVPAMPTAMATRPLHDVTRAACAALRRPPTAIRHDRDARRLFVALAVEQGWRSTTQLAEVCDCSVRTLERTRAENPPPSLNAARLCLGIAVAQPDRIGA